MAIPNRSLQDTEKSEQNIFNDTTDTDFQVVAIEALGFSSTDNDLKRVAVTSAGLLKVTFA